MARDQWLLQIMFKSCEKLKQWKWHVGAVTQGVYFVKQKNEMSVFMHAVAVVILYRRRNGTCSPATFSESVDEPMSTVMSDHIYSVLYHCRHRYLFLAY